MDMRFAYTESHSWDGRASILTHYREMPPAHPDITELYDEIERLVYHWLTGYNDAWWKGKKEKEIRQIIRGYLVCHIGEKFIESPYFNKEHPLYLEVKHE